jgi:hypothetical protein
VLNVIYSRQKPTEFITEIPYHSFYYFSPTTVLWHSFLPSLEEEEEEKRRRKRRKLFVKSVAS